MNWMKVELDEEGGVMGSELKAKSQKWQFISQHQVLRWSRLRWIQIQREKILFGHVQFEMPRRHKEMPSRCFKVVNLEVKKKSSPPI